jgi:adenosyl cobinamide kinase/adenosyl cobinamide phosphate guanylyltransferase
VTLTLVLGGIRSGKSAFAAELARRAGGRVAVVATGRPSDDEMRARIALHRRSRPPGWAVYEEPADIASAVPAGSADVVLLDSVDGWLASRPDPDACVAGVRALGGRAPSLVAISSEVGLSLVALTPAGRAFTDALGAVNQRLAAEAARVYLVVAGLPVVLKEVGA